MKTLEANSTERRDQVSVQRHGADNRIASQSGHDRATGVRGRVSNMSIAELIGEAHYERGEKGSFPRGAQEALIRGGLSYGASESEATA